METKKDPGVDGAGAAVPAFALSDLRPHLRARNERLCRSLCMSTYLGDYFGILRVLCRVLGRYKMYVDPNDHGLSPHLILDGFWEMATTEAVAQLIEPGMVAGDVGANLGYFTLLMADLAGPDGKVFAFEPNPQMAFRLERSAKLSGLAERIEVCEVVLCAENDLVVSFLMPTDEPKNAYARPFDGEELTGSVLMQGQRLDSRPEWRNIEFLKIDAEGSEQWIWNGMDGLLDGGRLRTIVIEVRLSRYPEGIGFLRQILDHGFSMARIDDVDGIVPLLLDEACNLPSDEDVMLVFRR
ncbi:FkbM family methyltransferase [Novosphingobium album (ex Hu et al. 2023)]|uniref:FkbM family methyltransferase n=1 Tax=Novosphingobium album (ex Hu et al. 2023) TaxID=2930093 RepID=A0ABT0B6H0_9SPHN|nr:FkbM family methyltransferase [Novosphingobium album (ex Hu et al. 2023)]MCJ2180608.1 FkbM family methyltransferase [Novosphingobium album (ex Hu et al. 2023)]